MRKTNCTRLYVLDTNNCRKQFVVEKNICKKPPPIKLPDNYMEEIAENNTRRLQDNSTWENIESLNSSAVKEEIEKERSENCIKIAKRDRNGCQFKAENTR